MYMGDWAHAGVRAHHGCRSRQVRSACFFVNDTPVSSSAPYASFDLAKHIASGIVDQQTPCKNYDFVVVGSGIAGLTYALKVAEYGKVAVITKEGLSEGCTVYAQGGVCAVLDPLDSVENHVRDTIIAGNYLNDERCAFENISAYSCP
jgi:heterodisulfide reductase subunit A-like polyferredoxin